MSTTIRFSILALTLLAFGLLGNGCANYHLGQQGALPFRTLYVAPVENTSFAPQAQAPLTNALARQFLDSGQVELVSSPNKADAILRVTLTDYDHQISATQQTDTGRARAYLLELKAESTLTIGSETGAKKTHRANVRTLVDGGLQPAEFQAMPALTRDLARGIVNHTLSTW